ncbi:MAG: carboxypeptidase regulatory-like domain-containing protein [Actinomycetota bacterium]
MRVRPFLAAVAACVVASALSPGVASAVTPGQNGRIAFARLVDDGWEIISINADGSGETNLTNNADLGLADDLSPAWSPDGSRIAFESLRFGNGGSEIYVMNADGTGQTNLTNSSDASEWDPAWSPDGTKIAYTKCCPTGDTEIFVMNADGTGAANLTNHSSWDADAAWSPDGARIAFTTNRVDPDAHEVFVMNADGTAQTNLTNSATQDWGPSWSPDGSRIAFSTDRDSDLYAMSADGSQQTPLPDTPGLDLWPAWSPDGNALTFVSYWPDGNPDVYTVNVDGTGLANLTTSISSEREPDWQATGSAPPPPSGDGTVTGTVATTTGHPMSGATIAWKGPESGSTQTIASGRYLMGGMQPGKYRLTASARGCQSRSASVEIKAGGTVKRDFRLSCR